MRRARWLWSFPLVLAAACGDVERSPGPRGADKASLFGDPTLIPTREGERARLELASAGEIAAALTATGWIDGARVDVEHDPGPPRVLVSGRRTPSAPEDLDARIHQVATSVIAGDVVVTVAVGAVPEDPARADDRPAPLGLPLALALLGLGASVALSVDRLGQRRRRRTRPRVGLRAPR